MTVPSREEHGLQAKADPVLPTRVLCACHSNSTCLHQQVVLLEGGLVEGLLEEGQLVVAAVSVFYQPSRQQVEVGQHPSDRLVEATVPALDEQYFDESTTGGLTVSVAAGVNGGPLKDASAFDHLVSHSWVKVICGKCVSCPSFFASIMERESCSTTFNVSM